MRKGIYYTSQGDTHISIAAHSIEEAAELLGILDEVRWAECAEEKHR